MVDTEIVHVQNLQRLAFFKIIHAVIKIPHTILLRVFPM